MNTGSISRLALGTAQFGFAYGIAAGQRQVSSLDVGSILAQASLSGMNVLDTASSYGESEAVLGASQAIKNFHLISKTLPIREAVLDASQLDRIKAAFKLTLLRLGRQHINVLLVHDAQDLLAKGGEALWSWMESMKDDGIVSRIGVSVYDSACARLLYERFGFDVVQIPFNLLDQRIEHNGFFDFCSRHSIAVHVRSVFLQGLILMEAEMIPPSLRGLVPYLNKLDKLSKVTNLTPHALALAYVARRSEIEHIIVGVHDMIQLNQLILAWQQLAQRGDLAFEWANLHCADTTLIDPRQWVQ